MTAAQEHYRSSLNGLCVPVRTTHTARAWICCAMNVRQRTETDGPTDSQLQIVPMMESIERVKCSIFSQIVATCELTSFNVCPIEIDCSESFHLLEHPKWHHTQFVPFKIEKRKTDFQFHSFRTKRLVTRLVWFSGPHVQWFCWTIGHAMQLFTISVFILAQDPTGATFVCKQSTQQLVNYTPHTHWLTHTKLKLIDFVCEQLARNVTCICYTELHQENRVEWSGVLCSVCIAQVQWACNMWSRSAT